MFKKIVFTALMLLLPTISFSKEILTIYAPNSFVSKWGPGPKIKEAFEKECKCELKFIGLGGGATILNRLRLEGKNTKADIVLGLDTNNLIQAKKLGLIGKHDVKTDKINMPNGWNDEYFLPLDFGYYAFVYDSSKIKNPPKSMDEFLNQKNKVIYQDPRTSTVGFGLVSWIEKIYPKKAKEAWKKLAKKTVTVTKGWSEAYSMFLKGESDYVLSYTTSPAYHMMVEKEEKYKALIFEKGNFMQIEVVGKVAKTKHEKLANSFMNFVLSEKFQQFIPTRNYMYPVIKMPLPKEFSKLKMPVKSLEFAPEEVFKNRKNWIKTWQDTTIN